MLFLQAIAFAYVICSTLIRADIDVSDMTIEGNRFQLVKGQIDCTYKPIAATWANCKECSHQVDCAVECALQEDQNKCEGFVSIAQGNGTFSRCTLASQMQCNQARKLRQNMAAGELVTYYRKTPDPQIKKTTEDTKKDEQMMTLGPRKAPLDAFDPQLCGNGSRRFLHDKYIRLAWGKIIYGKDAGYAEFPFQVMFTFDYKDTTDGQMKRAMCGGSLIDREWVLTAGHCFPEKVLDSPIKRVQVSLGRQYLYTTDTYKTVTLEKLDSSTIYMHPKYVQGEFRYDFILVRLRPALQAYTTTIKPICLKDGPHYNLEGKVIMTTGWGQLKEKDKYPDKLQKLPRRVMSDEECVKHLNSHDEFDPAIMLCTAFSGGRDQCGGDSGGPWAIVERPFGENNGSRWTLIGSTSWGRACGAAPGAGAKITEEIVNWIKETTKNGGNVVPTTTTPPPPATAEKLSGEQTMWDDGDYQAGVYAN